ncbi:MAG: hypothetical protein PHH90_10315 [Limnochordia bacterium]|nr:hypothetical protein [Limnochordia bacterium]
MRTRRVSLIATVMVWIVFVGVALWGIVHKYLPGYVPPRQVFVMNGLYSPTKVRATVDRLGLENVEIVSGRMEELMVRILGEQLPDVIILSEYQAADLLATGEDLFIDLTPFVLELKVALDRLDYSSLHYPSYWQGRHYFLPTAGIRVTSPVLGSKYQRAVCFLYRDRAAALGERSTHQPGASVMSNQPEQRAVMGITPSTSRTEDSTRELVTLLWELYSDGPHSTWEEFLTSMITRFFWVHDPDFIYHAFLHSSLKETWDLADWRYFYTQESLPSLLVEQYPVWDYSWSKERQLDNFTSPWNQREYGEVLQVEIMAAIQDESGAWTLSTHFFLYLAGDNWLPPDDSLPYFQQWKIVYAKRSDFFLRGAQKDNQDKEKGASITYGEGLIPILEHPQNKAQAFLSDYLLGAVPSIAPYLAPEVDVSFYVYLDPGDGLIAPWEDRTVRVTWEILDALYTELERPWVEASNEVRISSHAESEFPTPDRAIVSSTVTLEGLPAGEPRQSRRVSLELVLKGQEWLIDSIHWRALHKALPPEFTGCQAP